MDEKADKSRHIRTAAGALLTAALLLLSSCVRGTLPSSVPPETGGPTVPAQEVPDFVLENVLLRILTKEVERSELFDFGEDGEGLVIENEIGLTYGADGNVTGISVTDYGAEGLRALAEGKTLKARIVFEWADGKLVKGHVLLGENRVVSVFSHEYDAAGRLLKTTVAGGGGIVLSDASINSLVLAAGSLSKLSDRNTDASPAEALSVTEYVYDADSRLIRKNVSDPAGPYVLKYTYDDASGTCTVTRTGSDNSAYVLREQLYDANGRLSGEKVYSGLNAYFYSYDYDTARNLTGYVMKKQTGDPTSGVKWSTLGDTTYSFTYEYGTYESRIL